MPVKTSFNSMYILEFKVENCFVTLEHLFEFSLLFPRKISYDLII
jgi:hypothetical protein